MATGDPESVPGAPYIDTTPPEQLEANRKFRVLKIFGSDFRLLQKMITFFAHGVKVLLIVSGLYWSTSFERPDSQTIVFRL